MKPTIPDVLPLACAYYAEHPTWGSLHIVLDDLNVSDDDVAYCIEHARRTGDNAGAILGLLLLAMSRTQRSKLSGVVYRLERQA